MGSQCVRDIRENWDVNCLIRFIHRLNISQAKRDYCIQCIPMTTAVGTKQGMFATFRGGAMIPLKPYDPKTSKSFKNSPILRHFTWFNELNLYMHHAHLPAVSPLPPPLTAETSAFDGGAKPAACSTEPPCSAQLPPAGGLWACCNEKRAKQG